MAKTKGEQVANFNVGNKFFELFVRNETETYLFDDKEIDNLFFFLMSVQSGSAFKTQSKEAIEKKAKELVRLGQNILDSIDKGFDHYKNPEKYKDEDILGFKN